MRKLTLGSMLDCFCLSSGPRSCFCISSSMEAEDDFEFAKEPLVGDDQREELVKLKDAAAEKQTLAFQLKPKIVVLKVSMHCKGCAKKVQKHISKMEGVTSYEVDLERKMVVVIGDVLPFEVLDSVSKVKNAQIWASKWPPEEDE